MGRPRQGWSPPDSLVLDRQKQKAPGNRGFFSFQAIQIIGLASIQRLRPCVGATAYTVPVGSNETTNKEEADMTALVLEAKLSLLKKSEIVDI